MADEVTTVADLVPEAVAELNVATIEGSDLVVRNMDKREIEARIATWGDVADTPIGLEEFLPGAFADVNAKNVVLRLEHQEPAAGRGLSIEERSDGAYMVFRASKTQRGDEILTLAADGVTRHVSVGYHPANTQAEFARRNGKRVIAIRKADLREVSTTWKPYYAQAAVMQVRAEPESKETPVTAEATETKAEEQKAPPPTLDLTPIKDEIAMQFRSLNETYADRVSKLEERARTDAIIIPGKQQPKGPQLYEWAYWATRILSGERINERELQTRALDDIVTTDNPGLVPETLVNDLTGIIDNSRPFLETTRRVPAPESGMTINVPVLSQRSTAAVQATEKTEIESTALQVTLDSFDAVTIAGGADVSIQMIKRASPNFMDLLMGDLGEAYAGVGEAEALDALLGAGVTPGTGTLDPEAIAIGEAWSNSIAARRKAPDTIWLSGAAVAKFINAKSDGTNAPLYGSLAANFSVGGGIGGTLFGLKPVYVPALDATAVDVLIGPSSGFAWAEDGAFTLQVDVPSKAGRDIALVGIMWFMPRYPAAFTTYAV